MIAGTKRRCAVSVAILCATCLAGCAQVTVISDQGPPQSEWKFGVLAIDISGSSKKSDVVLTSGVGLMTTPAGATLGYGKAKIIRVGDDCRVVIATNDLEAVSKDLDLMRRLKAVYHACAT